MKLQVFNEYSLLEVVLVHRPGEEIDRLTHENMKAFLFEDIPFLTRMQEEHDEFVDEMRERGVKVLHLAKLLRELIDTQPDVRRKLIDQVCATERAAGIAAELHDVAKFPTDLLTSILFRGVTHSEYQEIVGKPAGSAATGACLRISP